MMKKSNVSILALLYFISLGVPVFADAGPIYVLGYPMYFASVGFLALVVSFHLLIKGTINIARLIKSVEDFDKKKVKINMIVALCILILIIILVCLTLTSVFESYIIKAVTIITLYSPIFGFISGGMMVKRQSIDSKIKISGKKLLKYSLFTVCLDIIVIWGVVKWIQLGSPSL